MLNPIFDRLKISPIPLETANKVTETGWMLEIERILNDILNTSETHFSSLDSDIRSNFNILKQQLEQKVTDSFVRDLYENEIKKYIIENLHTLIGESIKCIEFGLDDNGCLFAEIPEQMKDLQFFTNEDNNSKDFGKLMIL